MQTKPLKPRRTIHMVSNAHIDPVWLWEWEEGAATAISTFRTAAELCEEFDGYIFNHNEAILYRWVEELEPALFKRIQKLVKAGKWHIMGGWYLQPDCNLPSGESFVRQVLLGKRYFAEKFGVEPSTGINLDPFGHSRGLVQILARSGYDSYLFCRPGQEDCHLENHEFIWQGYDGSQVLACRLIGGYGSFLGKARQKVEQFMAEAPQTPQAIVLWGVGDHGGGPSRADLVDLADMIRSHPEIDLRHSTPEAYFADLKNRQDTLPVHSRDLNPWAPGCYTSQVRIKQRHRQLENELFKTEKMVCAAWCAGLMDYPQQDLQEAMRDLATCEFHDMLPGSSIQPAEEMVLRLIDHGLEMLSRLKARAFFALSQSQPRARQGEVPVLVYNPHPFPLRQTIECEFQLADQNWEQTFTQVKAFQGGQELPTQVEKELSNLSLDWRKRVVFSAELAPAQMNRFDCRLEVLPAKPAPQLQIENNRLHFRTAELEVVINAQTGLIDRYRVNGIDYLKENAFNPLVMLDYADPWGSTVRRFRDLLANFELLPPAAGQWFSGVLNPALPSVRIIEDGAVRSVVEAVFGYQHSFICTRYKLPKQGTELEVELRVHWNEKDRMLKLSLPVPDNQAQFIGQVAYGVASLPENGDEAVAQKWVALVSQANRTALTIINDGVYGSDYCYGELRLSLLRSSAYSALQLYHRPLLPDDRYSPRIDQGERLYRFWINGGPIDKRLQAVDREALAHNETPMVLSFFPVGTEDQQPQAPFISLSDTAVQITAVKKAEDSDDLIIRLFEPTGQARTTTLSLPIFGLSREVKLKPFEIRTYRLNLASREWREVDLIERPLF